MVLASAYGVKVVCGPELVVCAVMASGFYHGQVKGLLGNGNNEPYDDFTLPNGKIVTSESEFGNSYKTSSGCAAVQAVTHHQGHHASPSCDKLFGWESSLRYCYPFVPSATSSSPVSMESLEVSKTQNTRSPWRTSLSATNTASRFISRRNLVSRSDPKRCQKF
jgi:hypothetical protein